MSNKVFIYDVFLSHSAKDKAVVRAVAERLRADGLRVWFDEWVLKPGDSIPAKIEEGLEHSRVLVLCMSANTFGSDWAQLASGTFRFRDPLNKERRLIPLRLDDAPIKGSLAQFLYINWPPADREQEYAKLLEACRKGEAWNHLRDLYPGSPMAAILAEKQRLEQLDPRFLVQIAATSESKTIQVKPRQALTQSPQLKFLVEPGADTLKDFLEKGRSFRVKANEVEMIGSPIHNAILRELGDAEVTISDGRRLKGCLQLSFHHETEHVMIQIDGEWQFALRKLLFKGQLSESPLKVELTREESEANNSEHSVIRFNFDLAAWEQQPLMSLAHFTEIGQFLGSKEFAVRSLIRGNQPWNTETFIEEPEAAEKAANAVSWLEKCRRVAQHLGVNPPFPMRVALGEIESNDVRLLVKLIEDGKHEQTNEGVTSEIEADIPPGSEPPPKEATRMELPEPVRLLNFFGLKVLFGPLKYTWTNIQLSSVAPLKGDRFKLTWKGGPRSTFSIDYGGGAKQASQLTPKKGNENLTG